MPAAASARARARSPGTRRPPSIPRSRSRAPRDNAELQGKLVLEFTIAPNGTVTECRVVSSELKDPELERKIVALVRLFQFQAEDVDAVTATKPIDFFPTSA